MKINDFKRIAYFQIEKVYVGGRNKLYQLSSDLEEIVEVEIGPRNSSKQCSFFDCEVVDNMNKVLLIDADENRLIACNMLPMGACTTRSLDNISISESTEEAAKYLVATNESKITEILHIKLVRIMK